MSEKFKRVGKKTLKNMTVEQKIQYFEDYQNYYFSLAHDSKKTAIEEKNYVRAAHLTKSIVKYFKRPIYIGKENLLDEPVVYVSNHLTSYDQFYIVSGINPNKPIHFLASSTLLAFNKGEFFKYVGAKFVDLSSPKSINEGMEELTRLSVRGKDIFVFPQGTRDPGHTFVGAFNKGVAKTAQISGRKIIPISYTYDFLTGKIIVRYNKSIRIKITDDLGEITEKIRESVATGLWENMKLLPKCSEEDIIAVNSCVEKLKEEREKMLEIIPKMQEENYRPLLGKIIDELESIKNSFNEPTEKQKEKIAILKLKRSKFE